MRNAGGVLRAGGEQSGDKVRALATSGCGVGLDPEGGRQGEPGVGGVLTP